MKGFRNNLKYDGKQTVFINKDFLCFNPKTLPYKAKFLFIVLKSFVNTKTGTAFPTTQHLIDMLEWNKAVVFKNLKILRELELIHVEKPRINNQFSHNIYRLENELEWVKKNIMNDTDNS